MSSTETLLKSIWWYFLRYFSCFFTKAYCGYSQHKFFYRELGKIIKKYEIQHQHLFCLHTKRCRLLTLVLLNPDIPCLDPNPTDLDLHCLSFSIWIYINKAVWRTAIFPATEWQWLIDWLCWGLTTCQPLRVILCRLPEKGRKEIEIVEEMKEGDREERGTGMKVKKQKK